MVRFKLLLRNSFLSFRSTWWYVTRPSSNSHWAQDLKAKGKKQHRKRLAKRKAESTAMRKLYCRKHHKYRLSQSFCIHKATPTRWPAADPRQKQQKKRQQKATKQNIFKKRQNALRGAGGWGGIASTKKTHTRTHTHTKKKKKCKITQTKQQKG